MAKILKRNFIYPCLKATARTTYQRTGKSMMKNYIIYAPPTFILPAGPDPAAEGAAFRPAGTYSDRYPAGGPMFFFFHNAKIHGFSTSSLSHLFFFHELK